MRGERHPEQIIRMPWRTTALAMPQPCRGHPTAPPVA
jgi:hypothetical protein